MFKKFIMFTVLFGSFNLLAHEGHEQTPGTIKASHGGVVKAGKEINLEYVVSGSEVKLYPMSHDGKDLTAADVKLTATAKLPKGKAQPVKISEKEGTLTAQVDFKEAYRVEMNVDADTQGKKSNFKLQVEK